MADGYDESDMADIDWESIDQSAALMEEFEVPIEIKVTKKYKKSEDNGERNCTIIDIPFKRKDQGREGDAIALPDNVLQFPKGGRPSPAFDPQGDPA